jgi:hypothetical protein
MAMKRRLIAAAAAVGLSVAVAAAPASADPGPPGSTFPEQPNAHVITACDAVNTNAGTGVMNMSDQAFGITSGLFADACTFD